MLLLAFPLMKVVGWFLLILVGLYVLGLALLAWKNVGRPITATHTYEPVDDDRLPEAARPSFEAWEACVPDWKPTGLHGLQGPQQEGSTESLCLRLYLRPDQQTWLRMAALESHPEGGSEAGITVTHCTLLSVTEDGQYLITEMTFPALIWSDPEKIESRSMATRDLRALLSLHDTRLVASSERLRRLDAPAMVDLDRDLERIVLQHYLDTGVAEGEAGEYRLVSFLAALHQNHQLLWLSAIGVFSDKPMDRA